MHACVGIDIPAEFSGNSDLLAEGRESLANHFLIGERTVRFRGVEKIDAALDGLADEGDHLRPVAQQPRLAITHASEGEGRDFKSTTAELAFLHCDCLL